MSDCRLGGRRAWMVCGLLLLALWMLAPAGRAEDAPASLVDWLKARGADASFEARTALYERHFPGAPYRGTAEQNIALLGKLRGTGSMANKATSPLLQHTFDQWGWRVTVDRRPQVLSLELRPDQRFEYVEWGQKPKARTEEPPISATLALRNGARFVSGAMLAWKAKQFDDGLYAAVELAAQAGKAELLQRLRYRLAAAGAAGDAPEILAAACELGGVRGRTHIPLAQAVAQRRAKFLADELRSKPLGFYPWSPALERVFRQDRMLQSALGTGAGTRALIQALRDDVAAREAYERVLALYEGLTNPLAAPDLRPWLAEAGAGALPRNVRFLPPSRAHETDLVKRHWGARPVPENARAIDLLIREVRAGNLSLRPTERSGWYDHQTWALEPLLRPDAAPEAAKLRFGPEYRAYLVEMFKGLLALTRETHVKQLEIPGAGAPMPPIYIAPPLSVEPLATHYERRAAAYRFVRGVLDAHFGAAGLTAMHRLTRAGPVEATLAAELDSMEQLFRGAAQTVWFWIGSPRADPGAVAAADRAAFAAWSQSLDADADLARDGRMMVPVYYDVVRRQTVVWAFLGWTERVLDVRFEKPPTWTYDRIGEPMREKPDFQLSPASHHVAYPVVAEVRVTRLLNRDEFRKHCDRHKTRSAILSNLK